MKCHISKHMWETVGYKAWSFFKGFNKVDVPNFNMKINWAPIIECHGIRCDYKNVQQKDVWTMDPYNELYITYPTRSNWCSKII